MIGKKALEKFEVAEKSIRKSVQKIKEIQESVQAVLSAIDILASDIKKVQNIPRPIPTPVRPVPHVTPPPSKGMEEIAQRNIMPDSAGGLSGPEQKILDAIGWLESIGVADPEQTAVAFLAGYTFGGGGFNNPKGSLRTRGLVEYVSGNKIKLTPDGVSRANVPSEPLTREELHAKVLSVLDGPQQRILKPLLDANGESIGNDELAALAGYQIGGGFNNPKGRLRSLGLIEYLPGNRIRARDILFI